MTVHVGGKRTHGRYLLLKQRVEFLGDKPIPLGVQALQPIEPIEFSRQQTQLPKLTTNEKLQNHRVSPVPVLDANTEDPGKNSSTMIDLNSRPNQIHGQPSNTQGMNALNDSNHECASVVPVGSCNQDLEK
ncbi:B-box zinc finger protein 19-like isoform X2 [Magnolia sinica]|uniref:B-box zinc finger protein 19-like isoform X2 n=1 Tax=Magnolia sinica TaxID=86752 RepID=UPI0026597216|nr:B-box zinc finger protein 19-like isoform X2 [Magnolia sinica]